MEKLLKRASVHLVLVAVLGIGACGVLRAAVVDTMNVVEKKELSAADTMQSGVDSVASEEEWGERAESDSLVVRLTEQAVEERSSGTRWRSFCDSLGQGWVTLSALLLPGSGQVINRDYWKLPIFYGGMAGFSVGAYYLDKEYRTLRSEELSTDPLQALRQEDRVWRMRAARDGMIAGACLTYVFSVADALISHSPDRQSPTAAMVASMLLPGLGQVYNRSFWKVPIIYGGLGYLIAEAMDDHQMYMRYERAYVAMADDDPNTVDEFKGKVPLQSIEYGANYYRRYRDLSLIGIALVYALNIIDAYVDAHLFYWNVNEDVVVRAEPQVAVCNPKVRQGIAPALHLSVSF